jgi:hypothetical protein
MRVSELIDILRDYPGDLEIELAVVAPVDDAEPTITVDRFPVEGVLPWNDDEDDGGEQVIWLIGGDDDEVDAFLDAIEEGDDDQGD